MSKIGRGRPRKKPPRDSDFALWLRAYMKHYGIKATNVAAALEVRIETVYGWLAGERPENAKTTKTTLVAIYGPMGILDAGEAARGD